MSQRCLCPACQGMRTLFAYGNDGENLSRKCPVCRGKGWINPQNAATKRRLAEFVAPAVAAIRAIAKAKTRG